MAQDTGLGESTSRSPSPFEPLDMETLRKRKATALHKFQVESSIDAYTSPRALRRFIESELPELSYDTQCQNHEMLLVATQTFEDQRTCFVSTVCRLCRHHFHVKNDSRHCQEYDKDHPKHMLIPCNQKSIYDLRADRTGYNDTVGYAQFICAADGCLFNLEVSIMRPKLATSEVDMLVDDHRVLRNLQHARARADDSSRYSDVGDNYGAGSANILLKYLTDALNNTGDRHLRIKKRNKKFMVSIGDDFNPLLRLLKFYEGDDAESGDSCWYITTPEPQQNPTPIHTLRARMEDAAAELKIIVPNEETIPAWDKLLEVFQGDYPNVASDPSHLEKLSEEDLSILGCLIDYPPGYFSWAAILLAQLCPYDRDRFLDAGIRCTQQRSEQASLDIIMFKSQFDQAVPVAAAVQEAFTFFGVSPKDGYQPTWFLDKYYGMVLNNPSDNFKAEAVQHLEAIGNYLRRDIVGEIDPTVLENLGVASLTQSTSGIGGRKMSIASAARLLNVDADFTAEMVRDFAANVDEKVHRVKVAEALDVLAELKQQQSQPEEAATLRDSAEFYRATGGFSNNDSEALLSATHQQSSPDPATFSNSPPGLKNIGNTCYLNSLLQYFYNVKVVRGLVLNFDEFKLELEEEAVRKRRTGGNGTSVNLEEAIIARQFAEMLRALFAELQTTTDLAAQPSQELANTALSSAKDILSKPVQNKPPPLPARPSPAPPAHPKEDSSGVNVTVEAVNDSTETGSSRSSQTLVNENEDMPMESSTESNNEDKDSAVELLDNPAPLHPSTDASAVPQPVDDIKMEDSTEGLSLEEKMAKVASRLKESDRSGTSQQDVEEIIGNILEHLMRAIRPDGPMPEKPDLQADKITETFFTIIVNCTVRTKKNESSSPLTSLEEEESTHNEEIVPERWITAFPHPDKQNNVKSTLIAALDRYFSYEVLADGSFARYTTIRALPPILHICIQRSDASGVKNKNPVIIPETLFLDRYMETDTGSWLWNTRRRVWATKERIKELEGRSLANIQDKPAQSTFESNAMDWGTDNQDASGNNFNGESLTLEDSTLFQDVARPQKRALPDSSGPNPSKKTSNAGSPVRHAANDEFSDIIWETNESLDKTDSLELSNLREFEQSAYEGMEKEKYSLHAIICHGGGMNAGHYWVWIRDFKKNVWYKYNDSVVTEDNRESQAVLKDLNDSGDPYYVAYVRDEIKDDLVDVPQRPSRPVTNHHPQQHDIATVEHAEDVDMQTIEGVTPEPSTTEPPPPPSSQTATTTTYVTSEKAAAVDDELPPYEIL
ncbi:hypothetical protein F5B20DRAFT_570088 [Whalleya microplaca]|nr:hypothetical protein F5B20DRAFT_570088 [Whalleya microplaca]